MKKNCWEFKKCGKDLISVSTNGVICPASYNIDLYGIHDGVCGGRACWVVPGTMCHGSVQGPFSEKYKVCAGCDFYEYVKGQEAGNITPTTELLSIVDRRITNCRE